MFPMFGQGDEVELLLGVVLKQKQQRARKGFVNILSKQKARTQLYTHKMWLIGANKMRLMATSDRRQKINLLHRHIF